MLNIPALTSLHKFYPNARFTLVGNTGPLALAREFISVENVYSIESPPWSRFFYESVSGLKFDSAIVWMKDPIVAENLRLSGIPSVIRADPFPDFGHAADHLVRTLKLEKPALPDLWSPVSEDIIIHPGSGGAKKIWPHFDVLIAKLAKAVVLLPGGQGEGRNVADLIPSPALRAASPRGRGFRVLENLPLGGVSQLLRRALAYVGNDSGITHLAAYLGCPTIALFGPTDPRIWGPIGRRCRIIWKTKLEEITVNEVLNALHAAHTRTRIDE